MDKTTKYSLVHFLPESYDPTSTNSFFTSKSPRIFIFFPRAQHCRLELPYGGRQKILEVHMGHVQHRPHGVPSCTSLKESGKNPLRKSY